jgi:hypothetical protein
VFQVTILLDGAIWGLLGLATSRAPADAASALVSCLAVVATVATLGLQVQLLATALFVTPIIGLTIIGLLLRLDSLGLFASIGLGLLIIQLWASAYSTGKRLVREFRVARAALAGPCSCSPRRPSASRRPPSNCVAKAP